MDKFDEKLKEILTDSKRSGYKDALIDFMSWINTIEENTIHKGKILTQVTKMNRH